MTTRQLGQLTATMGATSQVYDRMYGKPSDWWNVGILIHEMLTGAAA